MNYKIRSCPECEYYYGCKWLFINTDKRHAKYCKRCKTKLYLSGKEADFSKKAKKSAYFFSCLLAIVLGPAVFLYMPFSEAVIAYFFIIVLVSIFYYVVMLIYYLMTLLILKDIGYISSDPLPKKNYAGSTGQQR